MIREIFAVKKEEKDRLVEELKGQFMEFYKQRPESIVVLARKDRQGKVVDYVPEITRPVAHLLLRYITHLVRVNGGSLELSSHLLESKDGRFVMKVVLSMKVGEQTFSYEEVGEAFVDEEDKSDTPARKAYTRALKRVIELVVGEDFINKILLELPEIKKKLEERKEEVEKTRPATERQIEILRDVFKKGKLKVEHIEELKASGQLPKDFDLNKALEEKSISYRDASILLDKAGLRRNSG